MYFVIYIDNLDKTLKAKRPTYVYYSHGTQSEWTKVLACEACNEGANSLDEMKGLKAFLDEHPGITGVILTSIENDETTNVLLIFELIKASVLILPVGYSCRDM